jgi:hypothetical protein
MQTTVLCQQNLFAPRRDREIVSARRTLKVSRMVSAFQLNPKAEAVACFDQLSDCGRNGSNSSIRAVWMAAARHHSWAA